MNLNDRTKFFPPNPFQREAVQSRKDLAGRSSELGSLDYYLSLTASGQSPHLALIGERGAGKTSLLNACFEIAKEKQLAAVHLDLTTSAADSQSAFWTNLYLSLLGTLADRGIEGGRRGRFYRNNIAALYGRPTEAGDELLSYPELVSITSGYVQGDVPTQYIVDDLRSLRSLTPGQNTFGFVFLIDEANCLKACEPLLQQLRNIFQKLKGYSLVIAGTSELFDDLSEVFSPIPRQFFKIDVKPFQHWQQINELIEIALPGDLRDIHPSEETIEELFELTAGDPSEVQLYLHHMYKSVELGELKRLALSPRVISNAIDEYRATVSGATAPELDLISALPARLLVECRWFRNLSLSSVDSADVEVLNRELKDGEVLSDGDDAMVRIAVEGSYKELHKLGVSLSDSKLDLVASKPGKSFWRSLVRARYDEGWTWIEEDVTLSKSTALLKSLVIGTEDLKMSRFRSSSESERALTRLRRGDNVKVVDAGDFYDTLYIVEAARRAGASKICEADLAITVSNREHKGRLVGFSENCSDLGDAISNFIVERAEIFTKHDMECRVEGMKTLDVPTNEEMHKLGRIGGFYVPSDLFGPTLHRQGINRFLDDDVDGAVTCFSECLRDREDHEVRNNLGFCLAVGGDYEAAIEHFEDAYEAGREPIALHNFSLMSAATGDFETAIDGLRRARRLMSEFNTRSSEMIACLVFDGTSVTVERGITMDVAATLSLYALSEIPIDEVKEELTYLEDNERAESMLQQYAPRD